jgi:NifU-like protein involved in Fe-S cluster formation
MTFVKNLLHSGDASLSIEDVTKGKPMAGENDLIKLYSGRILALAADIPNSDRLEAPAVTVKKRSPLCGSTVTVDVEFEGQTVSAFGQDVKACALGQAAASVIGGAIVGASFDQVKQAQGELQTLLTEGGPPPQAPFEGLELLRPAKDFKNRHASIMLALDAVVEAIDHYQEQPFQDQTL